ncbi:transposase domain-containing protein [Streptomyces sp. NPDC047049]|uniref:transposase domain-containing protein n=1 Tax=Streptomyces sp. NPDC047049 TaxID=3156688 RepID=UPI003410D54B
MPFEMVEEALSATRAVQSRLRHLPSRVVTYLILAACLLPETGYPECGASSPGRWPAYR